MDTHLKERLVGAAVLVAVAVILIPEMLSGPSDRKAVDGGERAAEEGGVRTYTIDLGDRARSGANDAAPSADTTSAAVEETPAPPPEIVPEASVPVAVPEKQQAVNTQAGAATPESRAEEQPASVAKASQAASSLPPAPVQGTQTARPAGGRDQPWAVQIGSFANQATADKLSQDLKRRGYASFVVPFKPGAQTLYRVRVGPMKARGDADAIVQKLKREGTTATVVANT